MTDFIFQALLKKAREGQYKINNGYILNRRMATELPISRSLDIIVIVQKNKTKHLIHQLQIEQLACANNQDILIFPAEYYQLKKDSGNLIWHKLLFDTQYGEGNCTSPGLLFYCIGIPVNLLANQCTLLGIVDSIRAIAIEVVPNLEGELNLYILE